MDSSAGEKGANGMTATMIKMKDYCKNSNELTEIDSIYLEGNVKNDFYTKAEVYDYLISHPKTITVNIYPYPYLEPVLSSNGEKYVRSKADYTGKDNLLNLPRV